MSYAVYRNRVVLDPRRPPTKEAIARLEEVLGAALPREFLEFASVGNGGSLIYKTDVLFPEGTRNIVFSQLYALEEEQDSDIETIDGALAALPGMAGRELLPSKTLPLAVSGGGDLLLMDLGKDHYGSVLAFVWARTGWSGRDFGGVSRVAPDWNSYLSSTYLDRDIAEDLVDRAQGADEEFVQQIRAVLETHGSWALGLLSDLSG